MTHDLSDSELAALFYELRQFEESSAPPFALRAPGDRRRSRVGRLVILRLAAAVLIATSAVLLIAHRFSRRPPPNAAVIAQWTASTDFLLQTPGREVLESVSYDAVLPVTQNTKEKGDIR